MKTKTLVVRGVVFDWVGRVCSLLITFFLTPFLLYSLGDHSYGVWAIVMSLTNYYNLVDLGLRGAGTKYIAQFRATGDRRSLNQVVVTSLVVYAGLSVVPLLISAGVAWGYPLAFDVGELTVTEIRWVVMLTGGSVALQILGQEFGAAIVAYKRFDVNNMIAIVSQLSQAILMVVFLRAGAGLVGMAGATLIVSLGTQIVQAIAAKRLMGSISMSLADFDRKMLKTLFSYGLLNLVVGLANRLTLYVGTIVTGAFLAPAAAAYYSIPDGLVRRSANLAKGIANIVMPVASQLEAEERNAELQQVLVLVPRVMLAIQLFVATLFVVMGKSIIGLWIGMKFVDSCYPALCVLTAAIVVHHGTSSVLTMLTGMGRMTFLAKLSVLEGIVTVALSVALVIPMGLVGVATAVLVAQVIARGILLPVYGCKELKYPLRRFIIEVTVPAGMSALPGLATALVFEWSYPATTLATYLPAVVPRPALCALLAQIACVAVVSAVSAFLICLDHSLQSAVYDAVLPQSLRRAGRHATRR